MHSESQEENQPNFNATVITFTSIACAFASTSRTEPSFVANTRPNKKRSDIMNDTNSNILLFSFIGDAITLGPHWVYDQEKIQKTFDRVTSYQDPITDYHPGKSAGDFTHYADQTLVLLQSITEKKTFGLAQFAAHWRAFWENPLNQTYRDGATKQTLEKLQDGTLPEKAGSDSHDIGGAARIGPLFLLAWESDAALIEAAQRETVFTHKEPEVVASAEFFCRVVLAVRDGADIPEALQATAKMKTWTALPENWIAAASKSAGSQTSDSAALKEFGLTCSTSDAFPGICHLLLRYPEDPTTALIENATAGGDSAARGMILGLVYGAKYPLSALPEKWRSGLLARSEIESLIQQLG